MWRQIYRKSDATAEKSHGDATTAEVKQLDSEQQKQHDNYLQRLTKLIPSETIAGFLFLSAFVDPTGETIGSTPLTGQGGKGSKNVLSDTMESAPNDRAVSTSGRKSIISRA